MSTYHYQLYCQKIDANRNMARYYLLTVQPTLFGETAVVRTWGRIGKAGGEMTEIFDTEKNAVSRFLQLLLQKQKRGYEPVRSCGNQPIHTFLAPYLMTPPRSDERVFPLQRGKHHDDNQ